MRVRVRVRTEEGTERKSKSKRGKGEGGKGERGAAAVFGNTVRTPSVRFVFAFRLFFCSLSFRFFVLFPPPHPPPFFCLSLVLVLIFLFLFFYFFLLFAFAFPPSFWLSLLRCLAFIICRCLFVCHLSFSSVVCRLSSVVLPLRCRPSVVQSHTSYHTIIAARITP